MEWLSTCLQWTEDGLAKASSLKVGENAFSLKIQT